MVSCLSLLDLGDTIPYRPDGDKKTVGAKYTGGWRDDRQHGAGKHTYTNGNSFEGHWQDGQKVGKGKFTYADGRNFEMEINN
jgi:hypothetical protein